MSGGLAHEVVDDVAAARALAAEWDELATRCGAGPLNRPDHLLLWWETLGSGRLLVVVVRDETGALLALAPLHERSVGPVRVVRWLGHGLGTIARVLLEPGRDDAARVLWSALADRRRVWELVECRGDVPGLPEADALPRSRRLTVTPRDVCPTAELTGPRSMVEQEGNKNLRKTLKRSDRHLLAEDVEHRVVVAADADGFRALLPDVRRVFDAAEAERPKLHMLEPPYEAFVVGYLQECAQHGHAAAVVLYVDDEPAAFQLCLRRGETLSLWIARFDHRFARFGPGNLVQRETYEWAWSVGVRRIDLLLGDSQTKRQWADGSYPTVEVHGGSRAATSLVGLAERAAASVRRVRG